MDALIAAIRNVRERLRCSEYSSEEDVTQGIVTPLLQELGWSAGGAGRMVPEYPMDNGRVDYALLGADGRPAVLIEAKRVGRPLWKGKQQLFAYCAKQQVPLAVLTDGSTWLFFVPEKAGSAEQPPVATINLREDHETHCAGTLTRYLSVHSVTSGSGQSVATTGGDAGSRGQQSGVTSTPARGRVRNRRDRPDGVVPPSPSFDLEETTWEFDTNPDMVFAIFEEFGKRDSAFFQSCARRFGLVTRRPEDFAASHRAYVRELPGGWWIDLWGRSSRLEPRLREACSVAGVEYGSDLVVRFRSRRNPDQATVAPPSPRPQHRPASTADSLSRGRASRALDGEVRPGESNGDVVVRVFAALHERDPTFLRRCAAQLNDLRRLKEEFPAWLRKNKRNVRELPDGWWLNVWGKAERQRGRLRIACDVAGISYGRDLKVNLRER